MPKFLFAQSIHRMSSPDITFQCGLVWHLKSSLSPTKLLISWLFHTYVISCFSSIQCRPKWVGPSLVSSLCSHDGCGAHQRASICDTDSQLFNSLIKFKLQTLLAIHSLLLLFSLLSLCLFFYIYISTKYEIKNKTYNKIKGLNASYLKSGYLSIPLVPNTILESRAISQTTLSNYKPKEVFLQVNLWCFMERKQNVPRVSVKGKVGCYRKCRADASLCHLV